MAKPWDRAAYPGPRIHPLLHSALPYWFSDLCHLFQSLSHPLVTHLSIHEEELTLNLRLRLKADEPFYRLSFIPHFLWSSRSTGRRHQNGRRCHQTDTVPDQEWLQGIFRKRGQSTPATMITFSVSCSAFLGFPWGELSSVALSRMMERRHLGFAVREGLRPEGERRMHSLCA